VSDDGISWHIETSLASKASGSLISLAASDQYIMAITSETDIFISEDGINWDYENFNQTYESFYSRYVFTNLISQEGLSFYILGYFEGEPGNPVGIYTQSNGEVWQFIMFADINNKPNEEFMPISLNSLCLFSGQLLTACDGGRILTITDCIKCSTMSSVASSDLRSIALSDEGLMLTVGDNFEFALIPAMNLIQDRMTQEQALSDIDNYGAIIIDVRPEHDHNEMCISGSINIPADEIERRLPVEFPDNDVELIFYCSNGVMAQSALIKAQQLGYQNIFNLGGLYDWNFDIE
jgi:rhodanese-related sulfurtransferase